jgi:hypothetical protein
MTWQQFVGSYCRRSKVYDLAAVVGQPVRTVERLRRQVGGRRTIDHDFGTLFALWHGRPPRADEWPAPFRFGHGYEWQAPEVVALTQMLGRVALTEIARALTERLRRVTSNGTATRDVDAVRRQVGKLGLAVGEIVGGLTTSQAAKRAGETVALVQQEIHKGRLRHFYIGHRIVIPERAFLEWKATRLPEPPAGWVKLYAIRVQLGHHFDHLAYHAKHGRIPGAVLCTGNRYWLPPRVARDLLRRRRLGLPMPWSGWVHRCTARKSWDLWRRRRHRDCAECRSIWRGVGGEPSTFEAFYERWLKIPETTKRHLTGPDGISSTSASLLTGIDRHDFSEAAKHGELKATRVRGGWYFQKEDVLRWAKSHAAKATRHTRGRMTFKDAGRFIGGIAKIRAAIRRGELRVVRRWDGTPGVMRHEVAALHVRVHSIPVARAARLCGVSVPTFTKLAGRTQSDAIWRPGERVQPKVIDHVRRRLQAGWQLTLEDAIALLGKPRWWVERAIELGYLLPLRATGDSRRLVFGRKAVLAIARRRLTLTPGPRTTRGRPVDWLPQYQACELAGITVSTLKRWDALGWLTKAKGKGGTRRGGNGMGWAYSRASVMRAARRYWPRCRFKRRTPPAWLTKEAA